MGKDITPYEMLAFQYKPLERRMKQELKPEQWQMYQELEPKRKIYVLDEMAKLFGL